VRRPPARRSRRLTVAVLTGLAGCADGSSSSSFRVVAVAAQPCNSPNRSLGFGVVVADDVVATAAHTVEEPQRNLRVDGEPARVTVLDPRTDLALLTVDLDAEPARIAVDSARDATVAIPAGRTEVEIVRTGPLVVRDTTDRARYRREVHTFTPGVEDGTSGAPLVDRDGRVLGIVVLDNPRRGMAYAVTGKELSRLLEASDELLSTDSGPTQGEDSCDVRPSAT
jgi:S1-C subfamily serine protease